MFNFVYWKEESLQRIRRWFHLIWINELKVTLVLILGAKSQENYSRIGPWPKKKPKKTTERTFANRTKQTNSFVRIN